MNTHILDNNDKWFLDNNRIDPLSRTPFSIGHKVVVCAGCRQVMLAKFYENNCSCGSSLTIPFTKSNVLRTRITIEHTKPLNVRASSNREMRIIRRNRNGIAALLNVLNTALKIILIALIVGSIAMFFTDLSPHQKIHEFASTKLVSKNTYTVNKIGVFFERNKDVIMYVRGKTRKLVSKGFERTIKLFDIIKDFVYRRIELSINIDVVKELNLCSIL